MTQRRRTKGSFESDFGRIEVESPQLADFLSTLSSGGGSGVLLEDLTVTHTGGVGGADENTVFLAGTSLEEVIRVICTGVPATSLYDLDLYNSNTLLTTSNSDLKLFEAGQEIVITRYDASLNGVALFEPEINDLVFTTAGLEPVILSSDLPVDVPASEIAGDFEIGAGLTNSTTQLSLGLPTSDSLLDLNTNGIVSRTYTFTGSAALLAGGEEQTVTKFEHVLPAFVLNLPELVWSSISPNPSFGNIILQGHLAVDPNAFIKQELRSKSNYDGFTFNNEGANINAQGIIHFFLVPKASFHSGTPIVNQTTGIPGPIENGITNVVDIDLDLGLGNFGLGLIDNLEGSQTYTFIQFANDSAWVGGLELQLNF